MNNEKIKNEMLFSYLSSLIKENQLILEKNNCSYFIKEDGSIIEKSLISDVENKISGKMLISKLNYFIHENLKPPRTEKQMQGIDYLNEYRKKVKDKIDNYE